MSRFALVLSNEIGVPARAGRPHSLERPGSESVEVILVTTGADSEDLSAAELRTRHGDNFRLVRSERPGLPAILNTGLTAASADWIGFATPSGPFDERWLGQVERALSNVDEPSLALLLSVDRTTAEGMQVHRIEHLDPDIPIGGLVLFRRKLLIESNLYFDARVRSGFEQDELLARFMLANRERSVGLLAGTHASSNPSAPLVEPDATTWQDVETYDSAIVHSYLGPLKGFVESAGNVPRWLQLRVLRDMQWYFTTDRRERAPTAMVTEPMAEVLHRHLACVMSYIDIESISALGTSADLEIRHALLAYKGLRLHSPLVLDEYDHDQHLFRISFFVHGTPPSEEFLLNGRSVMPVFAKYRACRFFRRTLMHERIAWLPADRDGDVMARLDGELEPACLDPDALVSTSGSTGERKHVALDSVRAAYPRGKQGQQPLPFDMRGLKARLVRWLARIAPFRQKFRNAWVFIDGEYIADDNAEHLYRWTRANHPEVNAWFLLSHSSWDWNRLASEGFRLVPPGLLRRLLLLNCDHIISSHANFMDGAFGRDLYGDVMVWRYTFLQHGVIKDDASHWLSGQDFDRFITTSPAEHASIVADGTPYTYTEREVRRTGLPRHDRLLKIAESTPLSEVTVLLVMPTWRRNLVDPRSPRPEGRDIKAAFAASNYATRWRNLLRSERLREIAHRFGRQIVFTPHPGAVPFIEAFDPPYHVRVATAGDTVIQRLFARTEALITDYTSVSFEMALLRRMVFYYQFDRSAFYGGDHNAREGYFSEERDGFGPVANDEDSLLTHIERFLSGNSQIGQEYIARMERAIPDRDARSCERAFQSILDITKPNAGVERGNNRTDEGS